MKKLLGISLVAVLAVSPLMASAETANPSPIAAAESGLASDGTNVVTAASGKYYAGKQILDADRTATASAAYVKGAYNAAISAVNKVAVDAAAAAAAVAVTEGAGIDITGNVVSVDMTENGGLELSGEGTAATLGVKVDGTTVTKSSSGALQVGDITVSNVASTALAEGADNNDKLTTKGYVDAGLAGKQATLSQGSAISIQNNTVSVSGLTTSEIASGSMATSNTTGAVNNQLATKGYVDDVAASLNTLSQTDFVTKTEVTANINGATGAITLDNSNGLAVAGNVAGTVPMMVEWGATTAQTAAVSGSISSGAKATGTISGIDITAPTYVEDTPAG